MQEDNPTRTFNFVNLGIGGTTMGGLLTAVSSTASFYSNANLKWIVYGQASNPHTLFLVFGTNDTYVLSQTILKNTLAAIQAWGTAPPTVARSVQHYTNDIALDSAGRFIACIQPGTTAASAPTYTSTLNGTTVDGATVWILLNTAAYVARIPDIILVTDKGAVASTLTPAGIYGNLNNQAMLRTASESDIAGFNLTGMPHIGLIDIGRYFHIVVDGFDPVNPNLNVNPITGTTGITAFPYALPVAQNSFDLQIKFAGQAAALYAAGSIIQIAMCSDGASVPGTVINGNTVPYDAIQIASTNGNAASAHYFGGGGLGSIGGSTSGSAWSAGGGDLNIEVMCKNARVTVIVNNVTVWTGRVARYGGQITPIIMLLNPPASPNMSITQYAPGSFISNVPRLTVSQAFGVSGSNAITGGNLINHGTSLADNAIEGAVLDATAFS